MALSATADTTHLNNMYIDDLTDAVVECAKSKGWKVEAGIIYKKQTAEFEFGKFTPAGRDFSFSAEMKCANINSLIENIEEYYEGFDVDYETYIWLDQFGHGRNGSPYRMRAVLEDMEATEKMIEELLEAIKKWRCRRNTEAQPYLPKTPPDPLGLGGAAVRNK